jgi:hypothetical protein
MNFRLITCYSAWAKMAAVQGACNCSDFCQVTGEWGIGVPMSSRSSSSGWMYAGHIGLTQGQVGFAW